MPAITCGNFLIFGIWLVFTSYSFGQLFNREGLVNPEISSLSVHEFQSSKYVDADLPQRPRHQVGKYEIEAVAKFAIVWKYV